MTNENIFVQHTNRTTGRKNWKILDKNYDYHKEVAGSSYGDMLNDKDRNHKYETAINLVIKNFRAENPGTKLTVLDIGTGTGLLSMMAARAGADYVYACESFMPMAKCAREIINLNGFESKIKIIEKHSKEIVIGKDMAEKADILVSEIFDTELLGESALSTFFHAKENLIKKDGIVIPSLANIYLLPGESSFIWSHNYLNGRLSNSIETIHLNCYGCPSVFDLQVSQLEITDRNNESSDPNKPFFKPIIDIDKPLLIDTINFSPNNEIVLKKKSLIKESCNKPLVTTTEGTVNCFITWWDLVMDPSDTCPRISTAPQWFNEKDYSWRDHWMQSVFFPRLPVPFYKDEEFFIDYQHDGITFNFDIMKADEDPSEVNGDNNHCDCNIHMAMSRQRIAYLNSSMFREHEKMLFKILIKEITLAGADERVNLIIQNTGSFIPLQLSEHISKETMKKVDKVFIIDNNHMFKRVIKTFIEERNEQNRYFHIEEDVEDVFKKKDMVECLKKNRNIVLSEPYVDSSHLPWEHLTCWYTTGSLRSLPGVKADLIYPYKITIFVMAIELENLHKIRYAAKECEGFKLDSFNKMITESTAYMEADLESYPLWQYPNKSCSMAREIISIDLKENIPNMADSAGPTFDGDQSLLEKSIILDVNGSVNGLAFWTEWGEDHETYSSSGPLSCSVGEFVTWPCVGENQGVMIFSQDIMERFQKKSIRNFKINTKFDISSGNFIFKLDF